MSDKLPSIDDAVVNYFRTEGPFNLELLGEFSGQPKYFGLGENACFGRICDGISADSIDAWQDVTCEDGKFGMPFDPTEVAEGLRRECYPSANQATRSASERLKRNLYYFFRPFLPVPIRKHLQRRALNGWKEKKFPFWPVDRTVDLMMEKVMWFAARSRPQRRIPFVWFWPEGKQGCGVMTHDVETSAGLDFSSTLMDLDDSFGIKSSFQIVPAGRYTVPQEVLDNIRGRGFEINVHDWNHDGSLFSDRATFLRRAARINQIAAEWDASGFRSAVLYRNLEWLHELSVDYDMSVPNVGHLDPQPGGCCTVMPYLVDSILEIPLTTIQDYSLFHIVGDYSIDLWRRQANLILESHGIVSFNIHPDYLRDRLAHAVYMDLLAHLSKLRTEDEVWIACPYEVNRWWRDRNQMRLLAHGNRWQVEGPGSERARVAYAIADGESLRYELS